MPSQKLRPVQKSAPGLLTLSSLFASIILLIISANSSTLYLQVLSADKLILFANSDLDPNCLTPKNFLKMLFLV